MSTITPTINTDLVSGVKQIYTQGRMISLGFSSPGTKIYKPRVSVYAEVESPVPYFPRDRSIDGSSCLTISVGGTDGAQPVDVIFEDGIVEMRMVSEQAPNAPWWENTYVRSYYGSEAQYTQLCGLRFFLQNGPQNSDGMIKFRRDDYVDNNGNINQGTYITWDENKSGDSILIEARLNLDNPAQMTDNKKIYFRFDFDCDEYANHTHTKWGILTLKKDPVSSINITWYVS